MITIRTNSGLSARCFGERNDMRMKIVILDGYAENPGDLSWDPIGTLGELTVYDRTPPDQIASRIGEAEIVFTNKTPLTAAVFEACPALRYVGVLATGYNVVDLAAATAHGVTVTNIPSYGTQAVAQYVFALLLELCHHVGYHNQTVQEGRWEQAPDFCYWDYPLIDLEGAVLGIVGYGRIGQAVATRARAFGMQVLAYSPRRPIPPEDGVRPAALEQVLETSNVISLHCPLNEESRGLICKKTLERMKPGVLLINTARGPLIVEEDLRAALESGHVGGAAVDVLAEEPPRHGSPLIGAPNCIITPHIAWAARAPRVRLMEIAGRNLAAWLRGTPENVVNPSSSGHQS